jgi:uncharacterized membrane protein YfcA
MTETTKWLSGINALLGGWLVISPFLLMAMAEGLSAAVWNNLLIGLAVFLVAGYNYYRQSRTRSASTASASLVALLGLWMIVAPFVVFAVGTAAMFWSNVVVGALVTIIAVYVAYEGREAEVAAPEAA